MKKIIKKYGNSFIILLNSEDTKIYNLNEGDVVEITIKKDSNKIQKEVKIE